MTWLPECTPFQSNNVHLLRKRFGIRTAKINGIEDNPARWPDDTYSIQGAADALGITTQTVFKWLQRLPHRETESPRTAMENLTLNCENARSQGSSSTHQAIENGGIMKSSAMMSWLPP
jgi:hypothetical protein